MIVRSFRVRLALTRTSQGCLSSLKIEKVGEHVILRALGKTIDPRGQNGLRPARSASIKMKTDQLKIPAGMSTRSRKIADCVDGLYRARPGAGSKRSFSLRTESMA